MGSRESLVLYQSVHTVPTEQDGDGDPTNDLTNDIVMFLERLNVT